MLVSGDWLILIHFVCFVFQDLAVVAIIMINSSKKMYFAVTIEAAFVCVELQFERCIGFRGGGRTSYCAKRRKY